MQHKILIYGSGLYKEIRLKEATQLSIGTDRKCHVWLTGNLMEDDFEIVLKRV